MDDFRDEVVGDREEILVRRAPLCCVRHEGIVLRTRGWVKRAGTKKRMEAAAAATV